MRTRTSVSKAVVVGILALFGAGIALAQDKAPAARDARNANRGADRGGRRGGWDMSRFRKMMMDRTKERLGVSDEDWKALGPKIEKVMTLARETRSSGRRGFMGRGRRGGRNQENAADAPKSGLVKATEALLKAVDKKDATAEEIKGKLTALREAREKAKEKLAKAQAELRELLTQRQEAQLVLMGTLD